MNCAGGDIRNIALHAAFLAADSRRRSRCAPVSRAARTEYAKLERPMYGAEVRGWQHDARFTVDDIDRLRLDGVGGADAPAP